MQTVNDQLTLSQRWKASHIGLVIPAIALLVIFFIIPLLGLLLRSVMEPEPGLQNYEALLGSTNYLRVFLNTFIVSGVVTIISLVVGFPVAWELAIMPQRWAQIFFGIMLLSMWTNLLTRTYAWMILLQQTGLINKMLMGIGLIHRPLPLINNLTGVIIGMTYIMLPFIVLPLHSTLKKIDPSILQAASLCGASRTQALWRILLPLSAPGMAAGALMVFVMSLGYFVTPALLGGAANMMVAQMIAQFVQSLLNWGMGGAAAFVLMVITLILYTIQFKLLNVKK